MDEETPILEAFQKMISHWIGGVAVVRKGTSQLLANISARDIRFLVANPDAFPRHRLVSFHPCKGSFITTNQLLRFS